MDDDSLEEQIRQTSEDSRALRELMEGERGKLRQSLEELQQLHSQVSTPISQWRECTWVPYPLPLLWDAALFHDVLMGLWPSWGTRCLQERKISPHSAHVRLAGTEIAVHTAPRPLSDVFPSSSRARSCQVKEQLIFTGISFITFETFFFSALGKLLLPLLFLSCLIMIPSLLWTLKDISTLIWKMLKDLGDASPRKGFLRSVLGHTLDQTYAGVTTWGAPVHSHTYLPFLAWVKFLTLKIPSLSTPVSFTIILEKYIYSLH